MIINSKPTPVTRFKDLKPGEVFTMSGSIHTYIKLKSKLQTEYAINGIITAIGLEGGISAAVEDEQHITHHPGAYVGFKSSQ